MENANSSDNKITPNNESHNNHKNNNNSIRVIELKNMYTRDFAMYNFGKYFPGLHSTKLSHLSSV